MVIEANRLFLPRITRYVFRYHIPCNKKKLYFLTYQDYQRSCRILVTYRLLLMYLTLFKRPNYDRLQRCNFVSKNYIYISCFRRPFGDFSLHFLRFPALSFQCFIPFLSNLLVPLYTIFSEVFLSFSFLPYL